MCICLGEFNVNTNCFLVYEIFWVCGENISSSQAVVDVHDKPSYKNLIWSLIEAHFFLVQPTRKCFTQTMTQWDRQEREPEHTPNIRRHSSGQAVQGHCLHVTSNKIGQKNTMSLD